MRVLTNIDLAAFWPAVFTHLWQSTLVIGVLFVIAACLRQAPARLVRLLWLAGLFKLLLPLQLVGALTARGVAALGLAGQTPQAMPQGLRGLLAPEIVVRGAAEQGGEVGLYVWLTLAWLAGAGLIAGRWARAAWRSPRSSAGAADSAAASPALRRALDGSGVPADRVLLSPLDRAPHVAGLLRPRIVLPARLVERLDVEELRSILLHEEVHRRRRDPLIGLPVRCAVLTFWYYPLLWPLLRRLHAAIEMDCDDRVLERVSAETYARALGQTVRLCVAPAGSSAITGRSPSLLALRLRRITQNRRYVAMIRHHALLAAGLLVATVFSFTPAMWAEDLPLAPGLRGGLTFAELNQLESRNLPVSMSFKQVRVQQALEVLAGAARVKLELRGELPLDTFDFETGTVPLRRALQHVSEATGIRYSVPDPHTLIVTPAMRKGDSPTPPASAEPLVMVQGDGITPPAIVSGFNVVYPPAAKQAGVEGTVIMQAVVEADGSVSSLEVLRASTKGQGFEEAALEAVKRWRYEPALRDGEPVAVYFTVLIEFNIPTAGNEPG